MMKSLTQTSEQRNSLTKDEKEFIQSAKDGKLEKELFLYTNQIALLRYPEGCAQKKRSAWVREINDAIHNGKIPRPFYSETVNKGNMSFTYHRIPKKDYREYIGIRLLIDPIPDNSLEHYWIGTFQLLHPPATTNSACPAPDPARAAPALDLRAAAVRMRSNKGKVINRWYEDMADQALRLANNGAKNDDGTPKMHHDLARKLFKNADPPAPPGATQQGLLKAIKEKFKGAGMAHLIFGRPSEKIVE